MKRKSSERLRIYQGIQSDLREFRNPIYRLGICKVLLLLSGLTGPWFFKILVDNVMIQKELKVLPWVCAGYLGLFLLETVVLTLQKNTGNRVFNKITFNLRAKIWRNYFKVPEMERKYGAGDLKNRIDSDIDAFEQFVSSQMIDYVYNWGLVIASGLVLALINWKLAGFGFLMVPVSFWMTKWLGKGVHQSSENLRKTWSKYEGWLQNSLQSWKEVKALTIEKQESRTFTSYWHTICHQFFRRQMFWYGNRTFIGIKDFFITRMNLYFIGGLLIFGGELTIGGLLVFMKYYEQFFTAIGSINDQDIQLQKDIPSLERVVEVSGANGRLGSEIFDPPAKLIKKQSWQGEIKFQNVSFRYSDILDEAVSGVNFDITRGERIAIVGKSGCGKTTLIKLLLGLYEPQTGRILVDNLELKTIDPVCLHQNMGVVMQDSILFNLSIKENLLLAKATATDTEIKAACKMAYIDEFIESLPGKYETLIGEKGIKLSGGQKQRMAIARVILANPQIVIFDEATSSLDHESEKMIHRAIDQISKDKTVIIVAHRLASVLTADRVLVIENGQIAGDGHHSQLLGRNAAYDLLFQKQYESLKIS